ncbi:hypothetical protein HDU96_002754 [Phlyctochytrium bullatum]|nr:hypothetical protein HDU96_002754 [Phlyctochytrium bullatum]
MVPSNKEAVLAPSIVPALRIPSVGHSSFPNELLRLILLHVHPNDLPILAAANRHLRRAVAACINHPLAQHHISQTYACHLVRIPRSQEVPLDKIRFDHPLLQFHHNVAAFVRHGFESEVVSQIWGPAWSCDKYNPEICDGYNPEREALRRNQIDVLLTAIRERFRLARAAEGNDGPLKAEWLDKDDIDVFSALEIALKMRSLELLQATYSVLPKAISADPESPAMQEFFFACTAMGYIEGLALIPANNFGELTLGLLQDALLFGQVPTARFLIDKGAVVNHHEIGYVTACLDGPFDHTRYEILQLLLEHGVDPNVFFTRKKFFSALVDNHRFEILELLLKNGSDPNARDQDGSTALHHSARRGRGYSMCIPLLLDAGTDVDAVNSDGFTALAIACKVRNMDAIQSLIDGGANLNVESKWPPLHTAAYHGAADLMELLLDAGAQVNFANTNGRTPLHIVLKDIHGYNCVNLPMILLKAGANPTLRCNANLGPLHAFPSEIEWNYDLEQLLNQLLENGADLHEENGNEETVWQKLCTTALRDRRVLQWVLTHRA